MALEYTLSIGGELQTTEVLEWLTSVPEFIRKDDKVTAPDLQIIIRKSVGSDIQVIKDSFGFSPSIEITFRVNKFGDPISIRERVIRAVWSLLQHSHQDAVFLFNGETVILLRINERLMLNRVKGFWTEKIKKIISESYVFEDISSI